MQQHRSVFEERANGVTFKEISKANFRTIPILLPPLAEQRAIAHALRTVQVAGEARRREIALERERKAALMHHLFTHGTCNEPTRDTEIGPLPESWRVVRLGEVLTLQRGFDLPLAERSPGNIPVVSSSGITGTHNEAKVASPGVVTGRYGTLGEVHYITTDYWPLNTTLFVRDFKGNDPKFLSYFLHTVDMQSFNDKTSVPGINRNHLHSLIVAVPSFEEQSRIADALSTCDAKIAALEREAALHDELFRAMLEELMSGRLATLPLVENDRSSVAAGGAA